MEADTFSTGCDTDKKIWPITYGNDPSTVTGDLFGYDFSVDQDHYMVLCGRITTSTLATSNYNYVMLQDKSSKTLWHKQNTVNGNTSYIAPIWCGFIQTEDRVYAGYEKLSNYVSPENFQF